MGLVLILVYLIRVSMGASKASSALQWYYKGI
ncbi:hypothetical protein LCGC14_1288270 [marine sediment metagenome]|uniref:Uncharacterized protein n=1 Tax=marine sediment metagenome TaxID=412755 RepID=A0A0F9N9W1_9ZZZZ